MKRSIIRIDENKCNGCGDCIPNCPEGAIQLIDGKARLISDLFCDGLGACLGHCPLGAITVEQREAAPYDERRVMENIIQAGPNTIAAHLAHLKEHGEEGFLKTALEVLREKGITVASAGEPAGIGVHPGCPGSRQAELRSRAGHRTGPEQEPASELTHWPVQLHLISPSAPVFRGADLVLAADCAAYAAGNFHGRFLRGRALAIACPKLDEGQEVYLEKLRALIDQAMINTLTVVIMEVPCCGGLLRLAREAVSAASRKIPVKLVVLSRTGEILRDEWA
ncbi:MAG: 4Fe-4S binding protein [bacterium]|nr:4Fe-4S binding protein [bacterium]